MAEKRILNLDNSLDVDPKLKMACSNLKEAIKSKMLFKNPSKSEIIQKVHPFPTTALFSCLASAAYQSADNLLKNVKIPTGWQLVTTATNSSMSNGYFGALFIQPESNHVVLAHRGTEPTNFGALLTDLAGIFFNACAGQMESACTFNDMVVEALGAIERENEGKVHFELSFTGHSLGAWLAQLTTFSNTFLKRRDNKFTRRNPTEDEKFHTHAIVFDSPGCLPMLQKLKKQFDVATDPVVLEELSICSYLSAPNQVNTCNVHFGKTYRVFIDTSNMSILDRTVKYTLNTHSMDAIAKAFNDYGDDCYEEIIHWPVREGITGGSELNGFKDITDHRNSFHIRPKDAPKYADVNYLTAPYDKSTCYMSVFSQKENDFLERYRWIRKFPQHEEMKKLFKEFGVPSKVEDMLMTYEIRKRILQISPTVELEVFLPTVKLLVKVFPEIEAKAREIMQNDQNRAKVVKLETEWCLFAYGPLDFQSRPEDLTAIMEKQFVQVKMMNAEALYGALMIYRALEKSQHRENYEIAVVDIKRFVTLSKLVNIEEFCSKVQKNFLLMVYLDDKEKFNYFATQAFKKLFAALKVSPKVKFVVCGEHGDKNLDLTSLESQVLEQSNRTEIMKIMSWLDFTEDSRKALMNRYVDFQGRIEKLSNIIDPKVFTLEDGALKQLLCSTDLSVNFDPLTNCNMSTTLNDYDKIEIKPSTFLEHLEFRNDIFIINGVYDRYRAEVIKTLKNILKPANPAQEALIENNILMDGENDGKFSKKLHIVPVIETENLVEEFYEMCRRRENFGRAVYWVKVKDGKLFCRKSFNTEEYIPRQPKTASSVNLEPGKKLVVITGIYGEGKTAFVVDLARKILTTSWIMNLDLNKVSFSGFNADSITHDSLATLIAKAAGYESENYLQKTLLLHNLKFKSQILIQFLLDGYDLIAAKYQKTVVKILKFVKNYTPANVIIMTRSLTAADFKDLQPEVFSFGNFSRADREKLLMEMWKTRTSLVYGPKKSSEIFSEDKNSKFKTFTTSLLDLLDSTIDSKAKGSIGVPEQIRFIGNGFQGDFEKHVETSSGYKVGSFFGGTFTFNQYVKSKYSLELASKIAADTFKEKMGISSKTRVLTRDPIQEAKNLISQNSECVTVDFLVHQIINEKSAIVVFRILTEYFLIDPELGYIRTYLNKNENLLPATSRFIVSKQTVDSIVGEPILTVTREGHDRILNYLVEVIKEQPDLKDVKLGKDETGKSLLLIAAAACDFKSLKILLEFEIAFGDKTEFKKDLQEIHSKFYENILKTLQDCALFERLEEVMVSHGIKEAYTE